MTLDKIKPYLDLENNPYTAIALMALAILIAYFVIKAALKASANKYVKEHKDELG